MTSPSAISVEPGADGDAVRVARLLELGEELAGADDRPGDEVGEEAQVDRGVEQVGRLGLPPLHVDHVGDGLEAEEADADRQRDRDQWQRPAEADRVERVGDVADEEPVVLEDGQHPEVEGDGRRR